MVQSYIQKYVKNIANCKFQFVTRSFSLRQRWEPSDKSDVKLSCFDCAYVVNLDDDVVYIDYGNCISNPSRATVWDKYVNGTETTMAHKYLCATMEGHIVETIQQQNKEPFDVAIYFIVRWRWSLSYQ